MNYPRSLYGGQCGLVTLRGLLLLRRAAGAGKIAATKSTVGHELFMLGAPVEI